MQVRKHIPNTITCLNLASGVLGLVLCFEGYSQYAFLLMLLAAVFDFCDGLAARMLGAYSPMGKELDSLADLISFGVLPAVMWYKLAGSCGIHPYWLAYVPLLLAVFSGLRLAKFNVDERQSDSFIGLPTPACALICGSLTYFAAASESAFLVRLLSSAWFLPLASVALCALLVSEIPMFSMKVHRGESLRAFLNVRRVAWLLIVLACSVYTAIRGMNWSFIPLSAFVGYVLVNLVPQKRH